MELFKKSRFLISNHKILEEVFKLHVRKYEKKDFLEVPDESSLKLVELDCTELSLNLGIEVDAIYSRIKAYNKNRKGIFHLKEIECPPPQGYQYDSEYKDSVNFFELCNELATLDEKKRKESFATVLSIIAILTAVFALFKG